MPPVLRIEALSLQFTSESYCDLKTYLDPLFSEIIFTINFSLKCEFSILRQEAFIGRQMSGSHDSS